MAKPLRVLIVEDLEDDAQLVLRELRQSGYEPSHLRVDTAGDMNEALENQEWDIVISDHRMPQFSSQAALDLLKKKNPDLPFIIVSGSIGEDAAVAAMRVGAHDFIFKDRLARLGPAGEREVKRGANRRQ